jgi:hypothetical protein
MAQGVVFGGLNGAGGSNIKSAQSGFTTMTAVTVDIPVSSIDITKSIVIIREQGYNSGYGVKTKMVGAALINSTTLRLYLNTYNVNTQPQVTWQVIEFNNVKSKQSGIKLISAYDTDVTVTISSINTAKSIIICSATSSGTSDSDQALQFNARISNSTTIAFKTSANASEITAYWQVIEFN